MRWKKHGLIFSPQNEFEWATSHAMIPTPIRINESVVRVYVTFCDSKGIGRPGYFEVDVADDFKVRRYSKKPLLDIGRPGTFDENGVLACSVVDNGENGIFLYYVGFELGTQIRYRLLTGLAISMDGGETFNRLSECPILERSTSELFFRGGPFCVKEENRFRMWYVAGSGWESVKGKSMPVYEVKYIESADGIHWPDEGMEQIKISKPDEHGFGRPAVIRKGGGSSMYQMFYSVRRRSLGAYRLGYAESIDGLNWNRKDEELGLDVSESGFDSDAIMYAAPIEINGRLLVFYNGNEFGKDGVAVAELEVE